MALILAIEPDRRQAARISALGKGALDAEVLVADSTERGVAALHGRHPDLILTSLLLSPKDEAGLREFEKAGVPVPTLMIPVLAGSSRGSHDGGGLFSRLQRKPAAPAPVADGCDPKVFAAQIAEYLTRAHEEREEARAIAELDAIAPPMPVAAAPTVAFDAPDTFTEEVVQYETSEDTRAFGEAAPIEAPVEAVAEAAPWDNAAPEAFARTEAVVALDTFVEPEAFSAPETFVEPTVNHATVAMTAKAEAADAWEEIVIEEHEDTSHRVEAEDDLTIELSSDAADLQAFIDELKATYTDLFPVLEAQHDPKVQRVSLEPVEPLEPLAPVEPVSRVRCTVAHELPHHVWWPSLEGIASEDAPAAEFDDVVADFTAALDESEPDNPHAGEADSDLWMPLSHAPGLAWPRLESICSRRPQQDEWGLYDPDQCGLSAVVAKLNQVTR